MNMLHYALIVWESVGSIWGYCFFVVDLSFQAVDQTIRFIAYLFAAAIQCWETFCFVISEFYHMGALIVSFIVTVGQCVMHFVTKALQIGRGCWSQLVAALTVIASQSAEWAVIAKNYYMVWSAWLQCDIAGWLQLGCWMLNELKGCCLTASDKVVALAQRLALQLWHGVCSVCSLFNICLYWLVSAIALLLQCVQSVLHHVCTLIWSVMTTAFSVVVQLVVSAFLALSSTLEFCRSGSVWLFSSLLEYTRSSFIAVSTVIVGLVLVVLFLHVVDILRRMAFSPAPPTLPAPAPAPAHPSLARSLAVQPRRPLQTEASTDAVRRQSLILAPLPSVSSVPSVRPLSSALSVTPISSISASSSTRLSQTSLSEQTSPVPVTSDPKNVGSRLRQELDDERERQLCVVCHDRPKMILVLPCRHLCMCAQCAQVILQSGVTQSNARSCPLCRSYISSTIAVFL